MTRASPAVLEISCARFPCCRNLPFGFGPLRFRTVFELDPHNSFIGAFANEGWIGGFVWIMMTGMSTFVGFRVMTRPSPYRRLAQTFFPALFPTMLQFRSTSIIGASSTSCSGLCGGSRRRDSDGWLRSPLRPKSRHNQRAHPKSSRRRPIPVKSAHAPT